MMTAIRRAKRDVILGGMIAVVAAIGLVLSVVTGGGQGSAIWRFICGAFFALGALTCVWGLLVWRVHHGEQRKYAGYGCPRCGYAPSKDDVQAENSCPCPHCGQPMYVDD